MNFEITSGECGKDFFIILLFFDTWRFGVKKRQASQESRTIKCCFIFLIINDLSSISLRYHISFIHIYICCFVINGNEIRNWNSILFVVNSNGIVTRLCISYMYVFFYFFLLFGCKINYYAIKLIVSLKLIHSMSLMNTVV